MQQKQKQRKSKDGVAEPGRQFWKWCPCQAQCWKSCPCPGNEPYPHQPLKNQTKPNQTKPNQNNNKTPNKNKNKGNQKMVLWNLVDNFESDVPVEHSAEGLVPVLEEVLVERPVLHVAIQHTTQAA